MLTKIYSLLFMLILLLTSCAQNNESITPEVQPISKSVYASGVIKSKNQYEVYSKYNGIITKIFVETGDHVKQGDTLFQLDNTNSKIATENAKLASENADYAANMEKLTEAENTIDLARKKFTNDSLLFFRQQKLWEDNIGSKVDLEQKELNYANSKIRLNNAIIQYKDLKRQLKLNSVQTKNNLQLAELQESDLIIQSEVDGVVYALNKEQGELATNMQPLAVIGAEEYIIELNIDEFDIVDIKIGQQVIVRMDSYQSQTFEASIYTIDPMMNERTRSFKAEAKFTKEPPELFPNLTAETNIVIRTKENALTIPRNYLINDSMVMLTDRSLQHVKTGLMDYNIVEIVDGLTEDSSIILPKE